jgi:ketopantoate hydroxymethyltransferase
MDSIKLEGGKRVIPIVKNIVDAGIPVIYIYIYIY